MEKIEKKQYSIITESKKNKNKNIYGNRNNF